jgi:hypothetical protein
MKNIPVRMHKRMEKSRSRYGWSGTNYAVNGFKCVLCQGIVFSEPGLSSVHNRNHCPYCLWSRHLDLYCAGDRLSACKSPMQPIGLTIKHTRKKYGSASGELMLIHSCRECQALSINRIAADDDPQLVVAVFENSFCLSRSLRDNLQADGICILGADDTDLVHVRLFGQAAGLAAILFQRCISGKL